MKYDAIIIGAGMSGLTCALKLTSEGKKILLLEKQPVPGGVATSFRRKGFKFEASLHFVDALAQGEEMRDFFDEQGVSGNLGFIELNEFGRIIYPEHDFVFKNDFESIKAWFKTNFPEESKGIDGLFTDIERFSSEFDRFMDLEIPAWLKLILSPLLYRSIIATSCMTLEQFIGRRIKDKKLSAIFCTIWGFMGLPPKELSAFYFLIVQRGCWGRKTAFIKGGFNKLFEAMVDKIRERGSEVRFNSAVKEIRTLSGGRVSGVTTEIGEKIDAGMVISNANCIDTLSRLIDSPEIRSYYAKKFPLMQKSISAFTLYLGLDTPAKNIGFKNSLVYVNPGYDHEKAYENCLLGRYDQCALVVANHAQLDPALAPEGKSTICAMALDNFANWVGLTDEEYGQKKKAVENSILAQLEKYFPGLNGHIEFIESATPKTMERYPTLPEGAIYGFAQNVAQSGINRLSQKTKIKGLLLCGAWTQPGCGVHGCFVSGIEAAEIALRQLK